MPKLGQPIKGHVVQIVKCRANPSPHVPPGEKWSGEQSQICSQKVVRANEIVKLYVEL